MIVLGKKITWTTLLTFTVTGILLGFLAKLGEDLYEKIKLYDFRHLNEFGQWLVKLLTKTVEFQVINIILISVAALPIYRLINRYVISKLLSEVIFIEDFSSTANFWAMNYWGSTDPSKTNRIENGKMIFQANSNEWKSNGLDQNGAYFDLRSGLLVGLNYEVECKVKSTPSTTMKFQLWLHDTLEKNSIKTNLEIPPSDDYKTYKLQFKATESKAIRIHLHCYSGQGQIIVSEIKVTRK